MDWNEAIKVCDKLGGGNMSEAKSKIDLERIISPFKILNSSCNFVWTPLVDDEIDGEFSSVVTGKPATYLPWNEDQPSGGDEENNVAVG